jgi:hypothetical protein
MSPVHLAVNNIESNPGNGRPRQSRSRDEDLLAGAIEVGPRDAPVAVIDPVHLAAYSIESNVVRGTQSRDKRRQPSAIEVRSLDGSEPLAIARVTPIRPVHLAAGEVQNWRLRRN